MAFNIRKRKTIRRVVFELSLIWLSVSIAFAASQEVHDADEVGDLKDGDIDLEEMRKLRRESKIWFARNIKVSGVEIPVSPVTAFTVSLVLFHVYMNWGTYAWCEASHILIKGHDDETVNKLKKMKKEIGNDLTKFQDMAKQHSACPSGTYHAIRSCPLSSSISLSLNVKFFFPQKPDDFFRKQRRVTRKILPRRHGKEF